MSRLFTLAAVVAASFFVAGGASAQDTLTLASITGGSGDRTDTADIRGLNAVDCSRDTDAVLLIAGANTDERVLDIWVGDGDCTTVDARTEPSMTCESVGTVDRDTDTGQFELEVSRILEADDSFCTGDEKTEEIYALYTAEPGTQAEVTGSGRLNITVDTEGPGSPEVSRTTVTGDTSASLSWEEVNDQRTTYEVLEGGECGSPPDVDSLTRVSETNQGADSTSINPSARGIAVGERRAYYIRAIDNLLNPGEVSDEICVERVETVGFCDVFNGPMTGPDGGMVMTTGDCAGECSVVAPGAGRGPGVWLLLLLALFLVRRP